LCDAVDIVMILHLIAELAHTGSDRTNSQWRDGQRASAIHYGNVILESTDREQMPGLGGMEIAELVRSDESGSDSGFNRPTVRTIGNLPTKAASRVDNPQVGYICVTTTKMLHVWVGVLTCRCQYRHAVTRIVALNVVARASLIPEEPALLRGHPRSSTGKLSRIRSKEHICVGRHRREHGVQGPRRALVVLNRQLDRFDRGSPYL
jgi:hypothetical protein